MAGEANGINNVYYLDVNPIFSFADIVVEQMIENGSFVLFCEGEVRLPDFQGDNCNEGAERCWNRLYDFSRTFGCVLRDMVLVATGGVDKVDPEFGVQAKGRNRENYHKHRLYPDPDTSPEAWKIYIERMKALNSFTTVAKAQELVANYDRMNPHYYIEDFIKTFRRNNDNKMENMEFDHRVYVFHHRGGEPEYIHQIDTYANISLQETNRFKFEGFDPDSDKERILIVVNVKTYKKKQHVDGIESYKQLCTINDDSIKHKNKKKNKKYYAGEHEG